MLAIFLLKDSMPLTMTQEPLAMVSLIKLLLGIQLLKEVKVSVQSMDQLTLSEIIMIVLLNFMLVISA
jgi:hypothetical protein